MQFTTTTCGRIRALGLGLGAALIAIGSAGAGAASAQAGGASGAPGAVYSMTNGQAANSITVFDRGADGRLGAPRSFPTGGQGTGTPEDSANGLILANVSGESAPINTKAPARLLLATNGGSDTISVFRVLPTASSSPTCRIRWATARSASRSTAGSRTCSTPAARCARVWTARPRSRASASARRAS